MHLKRTASYILCFLFPLLFFGQIKVSELIKESQLAQDSDNALYFVDFWATWCKPCIHVSKYLESLQSEFPNDFYILSLTQENPEIVKRFMKKHDVKLAVAIDFDGETFRDNNIQSLPYGILFNAKGKKLWEGHPADIKAYEIKGFLKANKSRVSKKNMFKVNAYAKEVVHIERSPVKDFSITKLQTEAVNSDLQIIKYSNYLELKGNLQDILAYALNAYSEQIKIPSNLNSPYTVKIKFDALEGMNKFEMILDALNLVQTSSEVDGEALFFDLENPQFWNTNQIDWGQETPHFLIGDSEIQADNVSLKDVGYRLANLLKIPIVINASNYTSQLHDWQIHYKYFDLMVSNMKDSYGISVTKKHTSYSQYEIKKGRSERRASN